MKSHATIDARSLAFGRAIVAHLRDDPALVQRARCTLARWLTICSPRVRPALLEWNDVLNGPLAGVVDLLTNTSERAARLRQSNPFAGVLPQRERLAILREFGAYDTAST